MKRQNYFKLAIASLMLTLALITSMPSLATAIGITVKIEIGRRSLGCTKFGVCSITVGAELARRGNGVLADATLNGDKLNLAFKKPLQNDAQTMPIDENITLDAKTSRALGFKSVTILKGDYPVFRDRSGIKSVDVIVKAEK